MKNTIKILNENQIQITVGEEYSKILTRVYYVKEVTKYVKYNGEYYA